MNSAEGMMYFGMLPTRRARICRTGGWLGEGFLHSTGRLPRPGEQGNKWSTPTRKNNSPALMAREGEREVRRGKEERVDVDEGESWVMMGEREVGGKVLYV